MPLTYRRPGVYIEESLLVNPSDVAGTVTAAAFVGVTSKGPILEPTLVESWSDYVATYGGFELITPPTPTDPNDITSVATPPPVDANLTALKANTTLGDGLYVGPDFTAGQYVKTADGNKQSYLLPAKTTNRANVLPMSMFIADTDITAQDTTNAAKLAPGTNEVQTLTMTGTPSAGGFTLTLFSGDPRGAVTTASIAYNATSAAIKSAIDAILVGNTIACAGGPINTTPVTLTYTGYGDVPLVGVSNSMTPTGTVTPTVTTPGTGQGFTAATPGTAWSTGQCIWIGPYNFYWTGSAWAAGVAGAATAKTNNGSWQAGALAGTGAVIPPITPVLSYLSYAVYSYFQNGGRIAYIIRAAPTESSKRGTRAKAIVNGTDSTQGTLDSFTIEARSVGQWGNTVNYGLTLQSTGGPTDSVVFAIQVLLENSEGNNEVVETFTGLSMAGDVPGSRRVDAVINDPYAGSRYILISGANVSQPHPSPTTTPVALNGGIDPSLPNAADLQAATDLVTKIEGPVMLNIAGYSSDASKVDGPESASVWVGTAVPSTAFQDRQDIFIINDNAAPRQPGQSSSSYKSLLQGSSALGANLGDSYSASYGPWIIVPNPSRVGTTLTIPPGGAVMGMVARIDATTGVFRAPAGVIAGLSNAVGVQTKFTDTELGDLNSSNINVIRSVVGAGIAVMGGRTRKTFGADRYVSARRTLIYIKEIMRRSTQFAVFENNDQRLWSALRMSADRILRPLWDAGGLRGASAAQAYYIRCDETLNTPQVIQSGEVRMEVGVALEYPAEFVIIRITQFDRGTFATEVQPIA